MTKRLDFGVEQPITIGNPGNYDWHVWRREPHGDIWMGFFRDDKVAVAWAQAQPHGNYVVNNVPPSTSRHYITGDPKNRPQAGQHTEPPRWNGKDRAPVVGSSRRKPVRPARPVRDTPLPKVEVHESEEVKAMRADAAKRLETHKAAEAADIEQGKTEDVTGKRKR